MAVNTNNNNMDKYFPNNIEAIQGAPEEFFEPCTWQEFEDWKLSQWELPSSVVCLIRVVNNSTGKIHEKVYQKPQAAKNYIEKLIETDDSYEFIVANHENLYHIAPADEYEEDE